MAPRRNESCLAIRAQELNAVEAAGAAQTSHPDNARRNQLWDELQEMVGLAGKIVMERDIMRRATRMLGEG